jgi:hypothetical protein
MGEMNGSIALNERLAGRKRKQQRRLESRECSRALITETTGQKEGQAGRKRKARGKTIKF